MQKLDAVLNAVLNPDQVVFNPGGVAVAVDGEQDAAGEEDNPVSEMGQAGDWDARPDWDAMPDAMPDSWKDFDLDLD